MGKRKLGYKVMPPADGLRVGCKVSWNYYRDESVARKAGEIALHNAKIDESLGYDFGYQSPGSVVLVKDGERAGMWEVCCS